MAHTYTPTATWNTGYTIPDDGDDRDAASVDVALEALGDRTQFLYARSAPGTIDIPTPTNYLNADWAWNVSPMGWEQATVGAVVGVILDVGAALPSLCTLDAVTVQCKGAAGHIALPGTPPKIQLWRQPAGGAAPTKIGEQIDTSATVLVYEDDHPITITGLAEAYDVTDGNRYYLHIFGESGTNDLNGFTTYGYYAAVSY